MLCRSGIQVSHANEIPAPIRCVLAYVSLCTEYSCHVAWRFCRIVCILLMTAPDLKAARSFLHDRMSKEQSVIFIAMPQHNKNSSHTTDSTQSAIALPSYAYGFTQLYPSWSSTRVCAHWILNDLYVDPAYRGKDIGKALMLTAMEWLKERGDTSMELQTAYTNKVGQKLYESLGWVRDEFHVYSYAVPETEQKQ